MEKEVFYVIKDGSCMTSFEDKFEAEHYAKKINGYITKDLK